MQYQCTPTHCKALVQQLDSLTEILNGITVNFIAFCMRIGVEYSAIHDPLTTHAFIPPIHELIPDPVLQERARTAYITIALEYAHALTRCFDVVVTMKALHDAGHWSTEVPYNQTMVDGMERWWRTKNQ